MPALRLSHYYGRVAKMMRVRRLNFLSSHPKWLPNPCLSGGIFLTEIILLNVRWDCRYSLSYRDLEEMMMERGIEVDHSTINRWVLKYAPELDKRIR